MNCMEALSQRIKECPPCLFKSFIIEFNELPEDKRKDFESYNKKTDFILYCQKCKIYSLLPTKNN